MLLVGAPLALTAGFASAKDRPAPLPGVTGNYSIVKPAPDPDGEEATLPGTQFRIGDTDVRISGTVTIDIAAGAIRPPRH